MSAVQALPMAASTLVSTTLAPTHVGVIQAIGWIVMEGLVQVLSLCVHLYELGIHTESFAVQKSMSAEKAISVSIPVQTLWALIPAPAMLATLSPTTDSLAQVRKGNPTLCDTTVHNNINFCVTRYRWVCNGYRRLYSHMPQHSWLLHLQLPPRVHLGYWWTHLQWYVHRWCGVTGTFAQHITIHSYSGVFTWHYSWLL